MDLLKDISENKFVLVLLDSMQYEQKLGEVVKKTGKDSAKICYVCLSRPYHDAIDYLKEMELDIHKFFFIDVLTSHYKKPDGVENCIFLEDPKIHAIQAAITKAIAQQKCTVVIFDTISSLLMYEQSDEIIKFTHDLTIEKKHQDVNKVFIVLKENNALSPFQDSFVKDVEMFTDKTISIDG